MNKLNKSVLVSCSKNTEVKVKSEEKPKTESISNSNNTSTAKQTGKTLLWKPSAAAISKAKGKNIPDGFKCLLLTFPDWLDSADQNTLYWKDGSKMQYDDGIKSKSFDEILDNPCIKDMFTMKYTIGKDFEIPPPLNFDPGRVRYEPIFKKVYGASAGEVQGKLVTIQWMPKSGGGSIQVSSVNGADIQLKAISDELDNLPEGLKKYCKPTAGTYYWRVIAGTNRLSAHSFGIAIDVNTKYSNYWQWDKDGKYKNQVPMEVVEIFEKYGFIWGGKWYHYDTMHFEYRPELLVNPDDYK